MKLVGKDSFQDCLLTNFCSSDFIVLIYLVWKLSPRETIQLEVSLSFKQILQLSTSLMMLSSTMDNIIPSLELLFLQEMQLQGEGRRQGIEGGRYFPWSLFPILSIPEESMEKALHFHAMEIIHQTLPYSISKVYLQVNSKNRCRNRSFLFQGLRKNY